MNHQAKQQHCCGWITVVVYRRFFSFFACLKSLRQRTCSSEYGVSAFSEIDHHHLSVFGSTNRLACRLAFRITFLQFLVSCFLQSMSLSVDIKMIRSPNCSGWILFSSIALCIVLGNFYTWTRMVFHLYDPIHDIHGTSWTTQFCPSRLLLIEDVREFCQDEVPNQRKRVPLLSTAWRLCRAAR